jgi:hypothetical protein
MEIRYLPHKNIDTDTWDRVIEQSVNRRVQGMSWWLNHVSPGWDALVGGDYEAVMPLPWKKKYGIKYMSHPFFTQQLGIFFTGKTKPADDFLEAIPGTFKMIEVKFNQNNTIENTEKYKVKQNDNYVLSLVPDYEAIQKGYSKNCIRNLKKAQKEKFQTKKNNNAAQFTNFIRENLGDKVKTFTNQNYRQLEQLSGYLVNSKNGEIICTTNQKNQILAMCLVVFDKDILVCSVRASSPEGFEKKAMFFLINELISQYSDNERFNIFDFSGSNIEGIARFNQSFGAKKVHYNYLFCDRSPKIIQKLKNRN